MEKALALILGCECASDSGCPACIQHPDCNEYNAVLSKQSAVLVLQATLRAESEHRANAALQVSLPRCNIWSSIWAGQCLCQTDQYIIESACVCFCRIGQHARLYRALLIAC